MFDGNTSDDMIVRIKTIFEALFIFFIILIGILFNLEKKTLLAILLLVYNAILLYQNRREKRIFFLFLVIFYFNFSFCITKYLGNPSSLLQGLYLQVTSEHIYITSIILQILFLFSVDIVLRVKLFGNRKAESFHLSNRNNIILVLGCDIILVLILVYHLFKHYTVNTSIFEYSIFFFIISLYFSRRYDKLRFFAEVLLILFAIYSLKNGDRIAVLQFLIANFLINYIEKISVKNILAMFSIAVFLFTYLGLYGDILDVNGDLKKLDINYTVSQIVDRRMALDTSVSSYFSGMSLVDLRHNFSENDRISNGLSFLTKYTLLGEKSNYKDPTILTQKYQINYGGAPIASYFYFWFGYLGVIFIGIYVGILLNVTRGTVKTVYIDLLGIYLVSTVPRWYLYTPNLLFRGFFMFNLIIGVIYTFLVSKPQNV